MRGLFNRLADARYLETEPRNINQSDVFEVYHGALIVEFTHKKTLDRLRGSPPGALCTPGVQTPTRAHAGDECRRLAAERTWGNLHRRATARFESGDATRTGSTGRFIVVVEVR